MEEKDLLKRIKRESELYAPDTYKRILSAAQADGLFNGSALEEEVYSDGETVALGVNKRAILITSLAAVAAVCLTIALPIALSGAPSIPPLANGEDKVVADIDFGDTYSYGVVTTARLAESFLGEPSSAKAMAKTTAVTADDFNEFGTYFTALDCFFGNTEINMGTSTPPADYQKSISLSGRRINGDEYNYGMYYTEYKIVKNDYVSGNPVNYYLEGVITASWAGRLSLVGERTMSSDAADAEETALKLYAYPNIKDKTTYALMEAVNGSYTYKIVNNNSTVSEAVAYKPADSGFVIKIKEGAEDKGVFTVAGKEANGYKVNYDFGLNRGEMTVNFTDSGLHYEFPENSFLGYKDNGNGTYTVSTYDKNADLPETLVIPATYNGKPVVGVGAEAFKYSDFKKVIISDGITEIGYRAFDSCYSLEEVEFPSTLKTIGRNAFYYCYKLTELNLPASLTTISSSAFYNCYHLDKLEIPEGVKTIAGMAFESCSGIVSVSLPASLSDLGSGAFASCNKLEKITVAQGNSAYRSVNNCVIHIANKQLVAGCKTSVIPADGSVVAIGDYAFRGNGLTELNLPTTITVIGSYAFASNNLKSINLPEGVEEIGNNAFGNCNSLGLDVTLSLPSTLRVIRERAFSGSGIESVNIPANVVFIGDGAFGHCLRLGELTVDYNNERYFSIQNCIIEKETKTLVAGATYSMIPDDGSVEIIGREAFCGNYLFDLTIPSSVKVISESAFSNSYIRRVTMEGVEIIGEHAFWACDHLESITFSQNLEIISDSAFENCGALTSIQLPKSLTHLGSRAFADCSSLEEVVVYSSLTGAGSEIFAYCPALKSVVLSEGITRVYSKMFYNCTSLETITIPETVEYIDFQALYGCSSLTTINFGGTRAEWDAIEKDTNTWDYNIGDYDLICADD